ncbi:hypothetical protein Btru_069930 [Bulinus truncatus]|nr:hypothetical protein Btru_069930 [Bulinus truncatus]
MESVVQEKILPCVFLGRSGMKVSNICLGSMTFGEFLGLPGQCNEDMSHQIINRFVEWGGNFIDTADVYGNGGSEEIVGRWLDRQTRENYVIATKVRMKMGSNVNSVGLSRRHITSSIDASLRRLHTSYVDLYQAHMFDDGTKLDETFRTFDDLVRAGKVRYVGVSNFTGWQLQKLVDTSEKLGLNPIVSLQQQYNLLSRESELEPFQVCKVEGIGVLPWSPLKGGFLAGKLKRGVTPTEGRVAWAMKVFKDATNNPMLPILTDQTFDILEAAEAIGLKHGYTVAQVAIRWLLQKDVVSSVIIGARTLEQLNDNLAAGSGWTLSKEEMKTLDDLSDPRLPYPYDDFIQKQDDRNNRHILSHYCVESTSGQCVESTSGQCVESTSGQCVESTSGQCVESTSGHCVEFTGGQCVEFTGGQCVEFTGGQCVEFTGGQCVEFTGGQCVESTGGQCVESTGGQCVEFTGGQCVEFTGGQCVEFTGGQCVEFTGGQCVEFTGGQCVEFTGGQCVEFTGGQCVEFTGGQCVEFTGGQCVEFTGGQCVECTGGQCVESTGGQCVECTGGQCVECTGGQCVESTGGQTVC